MDVDYSMLLKSFLTLFLSILSDFCILAGIIYHFIIENVLETLILSFVLWCVDVIFMNVDLMD